MGMQVARWLRSQAQARPEAIALEPADDPSRALTYAELDARACRVGGALLAAGAVPGDRLGLLGGNSPEFVATFLGALYAGLVVIPLPIASSRAEIRARIDHAGARMLVHDHARCELAHGADVAVPVVEADALDGVALDGPVDRPIDADAMLLYTSGTTGHAKAARISHASLVAHTSGLVHHALRLSSEDVVLGALPLTHSYGARLALFAPLFVGARTLLMPRFDAESARDALARTTWFPGVPTMFSSLGRLDPIDAPRLRWCLSAGAALPEAVRLRAEAVLGVPVREGYGLTEATFTAIDTPDDPEGAGSVGRPVPGVEIRLDAEGEVLVRGQNLMTGYLDDPSATSDAIRDGWLYTGDLGTIDATGRLRIVDRRKDLIVRGGFNVVPAEVEAALVSHPAIADALVVGLPDPHLGEEIVAVVVLTAELDGAELADHLRARIASTKLPRRIARVDSLPIGASGKALRRIVRDQLASGSLPSEALRLVR